MFLNMNPVAKKSFVALIIAIICTTLILLIYYLETAGKIIGSITFILISIFIIFEFIKPFEVPKWSKFLIPLVGIFIMLIPFNQNFINFINIKNSELTQLPTENIPHPKYENILTNLIREQFEFSFISIPGIGFLMLTLIILIPCLFIKNKRKIIPNFFAILFIVIIVSFSVKFLFYFTILQFSLTLTIIFAIVLTDSLAYLGGRAFGNKIFKRNLAPKISPNKTIEGALIGFITSCSFLFLILGLEFAEIPGGINFGKINNIDHWILLFVTPFFIPIVSILGDLLFSLIKRKLTIKDFSNLLPSHGGLLDRFDSMILVFFLFPFFIAFVK